MRETPAPRRMLAHGLADGTAVPPDLDESWLALLPNGDAASDLTRDVVRKSGAPRPLVLKSADTRSSWRSQRAARLGGSPSTRGCQVASTRGRRTLARRTGGGLVGCAGSGDSHDQVRVAYGCCSGMAWFWGLFLCCACLARGGAAVEHDAACSCGRRRSLAPLARNGNLLRRKRPHHIP